MRYISYQIKGVNAQNVASVRIALLDISLVEQVELTIQEESQDGTAVLRLKGDIESTPENLQTLDMAVTNAVSSLGCTLVSSGEPLSRAYTTAPTPPDGKKVPLWAAIGAVITATVVAVLLTFAIMTMQHQNAAKVQNPSDETQVTLDELDLIDKLFQNLSPMEMDRDVLLDAVIDAYISATGDRYAQYYTKEEYAEMIASQKGEMVGIGVTVMLDEVTMDGAICQAIKIVSVYTDSPAEKSGLKVGDAIVYVGKDEDMARIQDIGYETALARIKGQEGTLAEFTVYRAKDNAEEPYELIEFSIRREKIITYSVMGKVCETNAEVGIIRIISFDDTTPSQFDEAVAKLQKDGCKKFVFDLRDNPGGNLTSVIDVMTYFLNQDDIILTAKDKEGKVTEYKVGKSNSKDYVQSGSGKLKTEDVGKYRDLDFVVLVNENTASAAELFTANMRDYELGQIVGVKTYGKGTMQQTRGLLDYGYDGALKLTTHHYYPPSGEGYDGIGITPDEVVETTQTGTANLPHAEDEQLQAAVGLLKQ